MKRNSTAEISVKNKDLGNSPCEIFWIIFKMDKEGKQTNGPNNKEIEDHAQDASEQRVEKYTKKSKDYLQQLFTARQHKRKQKNNN